MCLQSASSPEVTENKKPLFFPITVEGQQVLVSSSSRNASDLCKSSCLSTMANLHMKLKCYSVLPVSPCWGAAAGPGCCQRCQSLWSYCMLLHAPHHQANLHLLQRSISTAASCLSPASALPLTTEFTMTFSQSGSAVLEYRARAKVGWGEPCGWVKCNSEGDKRQQRDVRGTRDNPRLPILLPWTHSCMRRLLLSACLSSLHVQ